MKETVTTAMWCGIFYQITSHTVAEEEPINSENPV